MYWLKIFINGEKVQENDEKTKGQQAVEKNYLIIRMRNV